MATKRSLLRRRARGSTHGRSCCATPVVLMPAAWPAGLAMRPAGRSRAAAEAASCAAALSRVRSPSSADAVAVVMTRRHLQAPAALEHHPAQAGPRHAAEACLSCMVGAAHAHRQDLCAGAQPNRRRGRCCRRRPADAAFHHQQHHHQAAWPGASLLASRSSARPPLCTAAVLDAAGAAAPDVRPRCHGIPVLCGVVCEVDTPSTLHHKL